MRLISVYDCAIFPAVYISPVHGFSAARTELKLQGFGVTLVPALSAKGPVHFQLREESRALQHLVGSKRTVEKYRRK